MLDASKFGRDLIGYGPRPPAVHWPGGAKLAVSLVVNYEEGSERSYAWGDPDQELMHEWGAYPLPSGTRNLAMESMYDYGARVGIWRLFSIFQRTDVPATIFACAQAVERSPEVAEHLRGGVHEVCSHGYRWEEVFLLSREEEQRHIQLAIDSFTKTIGTRPVGWYSRFGPSINTRALLVEEGGFLYDSDSYADDTPYWVNVSGRHHLVLPYVPDSNDIKYWLSPGFASPGDFTEYLTSTFDCLYEEGATQPRMMTIGLHPRIVGRPARARALEQFIRYAKNHTDVWFATRRDIAHAWIDLTQGGNDGS